MVKAGTSVNQSAFIYELIWMIITVSVVDNYFVLYEKLFLQFLQSLQPSESSRTGMLINLQPPIEDVLHQSALPLRTVVHCVYLH